MNAFDQSLCMISLETGLTNISSYVYSVFRYREELPCILGQEKVFQLWITQLDWDCRKSLRRP